MVIPKKYSHEYLMCIPQNLCAAIMEEVRKAVSALLLSDEEKQLAIDNAAHSKVCDLTDTISITFA